MDNISIDELRQIFVNYIPMEAHFLLAAGKRKDIIEKLIEIAERGNNGNWPQGNPGYPQNFDKDGPHLIQFAGEVKPRWLYWISLYQYWRECAGVGEWKPCVLSKTASYVGKAVAMQFENLDKE
jgi:hypothetical protein